MSDNDQDIHGIDEAAVAATLEHNVRPDGARVSEVLARAAEMRGLGPDDVAVLATISDPELLDRLCEMARRVKDTIYGKRLVVFAPLYISNLCGNECLYCAFRARNRAITRKTLTQDEIAAEVRILEKQGHKRVLMVAGEAYPGEGFEYVLKSIRTIYATRTGKGVIRRVNVNVAPLTADEFRRLHDEKIGTYQLFQETYHHATYSRMHTAGRKADYPWRLGALDRAMQAGIDDVGIGVLFGLFDWRFEILGMLQHIRHLEERFGVGPHTISVPRLEPATGSELAAHPPFAVSDVDFRKIVAILRLAVPYTGIIMSTRETASMRRETFALGVSQISAGSRTNPGGYNEADDGAADGQFSLGDHRPLDEVIRDVAGMGYLPSFCTGCYRLGRTGADFMDLAKPGEIKAHCDPNGVSTFMEYLLDFASPETRRVGEALVERLIGEMKGTPRERVDELVRLVRSGKRDVYC